MYRTAAKRLATHIRTFNRPAIVKPARLCTSAASDDEELLHSSDGETMVSQFTEDQARLLAASLPHVQRLGWTEAAMMAGAKDIGVSPSIVRSFWKEAAFVEVQKMSQAITTIKDVTPQTKKYWTVKVQVVEKFVPHEIPGTSKSSQRLILADAEGTRVEAVVFGSESDIQSILKLHHKYRISNARVTVNDRKHRIIPYEYQWIITATTTVDEVHDYQDVPFKTPWLSLVPFSNLHEYISTVVKVDVLAVVVDVLPRRHIETKYGEKVIQELIVLNEENKPTKLIMWDHFAKNEVDLIQNLLPEWPIILAMRLKVDSYYGISLSTLASSSVSVNPNLPEANHLRSWIVENEVMLKETKIQKKYQLLLKKSSSLGTTSEPIKIS